jgi:hypothetical protein
VQAWARSAAEHPTQVVRIPADNPDSSSRDRNHYVNWKCQQQPGRGDPGHTRDHEQHIEFGRKLIAEHGFDDRGTDESRD